MTEIPGGIYITCIWIKNPSAIVHVNGAECTRKLACPKKTYLGFGTAQNSKVKLPKTLLT